MADDRLLVLVSDRSVAPLVAAAHQIQQERGGSEIQIRTVTQLNELEDSQLQTLVKQHSQLLLLGIFGEPVERLLALNYPAAQLRYAIHSDRRLLSLSQDRGGELFKGQVPQLVMSESSRWIDLKQLQARQQQFPLYRDWLQARGYWIHRSVKNTRSLLSMVISSGADRPALEEVAQLRFGLHGASSVQWLNAESLASALSDQQPVVWLLDHQSGDLAGEWQLHTAYCRNLQAQCVSVLSGWGEPSVAAVEAIRDIMAARTHPSAAVVSIHDFVIGGGQGREAVEDLLAELSLPVLKGVRLNKLNAHEFQLSGQGIPRDSVHYRIAMPELQGVSQPQVVALASSAEIDAATGAKLQLSEPMLDEVTRQTRRVQRWLDLQQKANRDKRVAIVYYNHPPGRHNIGADNLNVPESLLEMLRSLKAAGYQTGELPADAEALLDLLQERGINLPEDAQALEAMSSKVATLSRAQYRAWFATLPEAVQAEMEGGPLAALQNKVEQGVADAVSVQSLTERQQRLDLLQDFTDNTLTDLHHAVDGLRHKGRERALDLLDQLEREYQQQLNQAKQGDSVHWEQSRGLRDALLAMGIEGIRGWGEAPGKVMVWKDQVLLPGLRFGNVFIGPQPPRGWEINEELLHANLSFPPPHQYLGFYHYIQLQFQADAVIHVGRHSTYEFLPKRSVGLSSEDYPSLAAGDLPGIYPYIVDGVGEGIQAKRRGLAVMVDHLTPPLAITELYDDLLQLRQLIESAEAATDASTRSRAVETLRRTIDELNLRDELIASMDEELQVRGVGFDEVDEDFLLHEVGHYLTHIQESFMPLGLHVFGRDWEQSALQTMLNSMLEGGEDEAQRQRWQHNLSISPVREMQALLAGLNGQFVEPGKGNDPIRTPEALPTGRNFYALDGSLLPTRVGYNIGRQLADEVLAGKTVSVDGYSVDSADPRNKQGVILWASDAVRDEGAMIAFGMKLLGVQPVWNSRGIIKGLERLPLGEDHSTRQDVVFTTSGLFRDLYGEHLVLLDKATLLALDASADLIAHDYPALRAALESALAPLGEWRQGGSEPLSRNRVAANWVNEARQLLRQKPQLSADMAGRQASLRVFGDAPGSYGAGINRLVERSGAWEDRSELAEVFIQRIGHAYGAGYSGEASQELYRQQLANVSDTFLGRASNLYSLLDNNDAFDYLGGLNLAVESVSGSQPNSSVINHADNRNLRIDGLPQALLSELRGRFFNPQWIKPLMEEGYAGARTMGSEFVEYLWGWQVTSPEIISDQVWEELKSIYIDDRHQLGLDQFLADGHNRHVQTNMLAVMLVAIDKGFWEASAETTQQLAQQFAENILQVGIPGSGHSHANHPMYDLVKSQLSVEQATELEQVLAASRLQLEQSDAAPTHVQELQLEEIKSSVSESEESSEHGESSESNADNRLPWLLLGLVVLMLAGWWRGRRLVG